MPSLNHLIAPFNRYSPITLSRLIDEVQGIKVDELRTTKGIMMKAISSLAAILAFALPLAVGLNGCGTLNNARPLEEGRHQVGLTVGGPMVMLSGAPIPLPNAVVEGRHGVATIAERPLDINYGLNLTGTAFGILQVHVGTSYLIMAQKGSAPALSVSNRLFIASNLLGAGDKADPDTKFWAADQLELTASWLLGDHLLYVGLGQYFDFGNPALTLTPSVGADFDPGERGGFRLHTELRYYAINQPHKVAAVTWVFPESVGALGFNFGFSYAF